MLFNRRFLVPGPLAPVSEYIHTAGKLFRCCEVVNLWRVEGNTGTQMYLTYSDRGSQSCVLLSGRETQTRFTDVITISLELNGL